MSFRYLKLPLILALSLLMLGCVRFYSLLPEIRTVPLNNPHQLYVAGPFRLQIFAGSTKAKVVMAAGMGGQLTEVKIEQTGELLKIVPKVSAIPADIHHILLKVYLTNPSEIEIEGANPLVITNLHQQFYKLILKNVPTTKVNGSVILPDLTLIHCGRFNANGKTFLGHLIQVGDANVIMDQVGGGAVTIASAGAGNVQLKGQHMGLTEVIHHGSGSITINNTGAPPYARPLKLDSQGNGRIRLMGIQNSILNTNLNTTESIELSGYIDQLFAEVHGHTRFINPNLAVNRAYIKTYDQSVIRFSVINQLFANSFNQSRIEYYGYPKRKFEQATAGSAILPLSTFLGSYSSH